MRVKAIVVPLLAMLMAVSAAQAQEADRLQQVRERGALEVAVYRDFPPYSYLGADGQYTGVDVAIARLMAKSLGVSLRVRPFTADENMEDDLRNQVWKGHYLGGGVADVMLRVGMDPAFIRQQDKVDIFNAYGRESLAVVYREAALGKVETPLDLSRGKVAVEIDSISDYYVSGAFNGRLRERAVRAPSLTAAVAAYLGGEAEAVMGPRGELEGVLFAAGERVQGDLAVTEFAGMFRTAWDVGMAVARGNPELKAALVEAMATLRAEGSLDAAFAQHGLSPQTPEAVQTAKASP